MSLLEGLDSEETKEKIKQNYLPILLVNWQVRAMSDSLIRRLSCKDAWRD